MRLGGVPFGELTEEHLVALVTDGQRETEFLDFKLQVPAPRDATAKRKMCKSVSSFANARGGILLYGVREDEHGVASELVGVGSGESRDELELRLRQTIHSGIDPIPPTYDLRFIDVAGLSCPILVVGVGESFAGPHEVLEATGRYFVRHGNGNRVMEREELRMAFIRPESWEAEALNVHSGRVDGAPGPGFIQTGGCLVFHVLPLGRLSNFRRQPDFVGLQQELSEHGSELMRYGSWDYSIDGFEWRAGGSQQREKAGRWLRVGGFEYVSVKGWSRPSASEDATVVVAGDVRAQVECAARVGVKSLSSTIGVDPPFGLFLTVRVFRKAYLETAYNQHGELTRLQTRVTVAPGFVDSMDSDPTTALQPMFDHLAQAAGVQGFPARPAEG